MSLTAGTRLGPYEIVGLLGAGGMGEVYRARDTRIGRSVAIKVLPEVVARDPQFRERFDREARAISALEHPNICPLYDLGSSQECDYLVMPLLEGETLAERLARGPLPLEGALQHAIEIASALDRAHSRGIVHRDLKPGNVMLVRTAPHAAPRATLLDFGLAKSAPASGFAMSGAPPPTMTTPLTAQGSIVGTFQYMAPEQIEGEEADARSDIWAFGCVLYEMLTGVRAFQGKSQASLIGAILKDEPPAITAVQPVTPRALDHVVRRCLAKDPDGRWQHVRDVQAELEWIAAAGSDPAPVPASRSTPARLPWIAGAAAAGAAVALFAAWLVSGDSAPPGTPARFAIAPPAGLAIPPISVPAVSFDGTRILFTAAASEPPTGTRANAAPVAQRRLVLRALDEPHVTPLPVPGFDGFFSPDGAWVGYFHGGSVKKVRLTGGEVTALGDARNPRGGSWTHDNRIVFAAEAYGPLWTVNADGGTPQPLTALDVSRQEVSHRLPQALPDGRIIFTILTDDAAKPAVAIVEAAGGAHRVLIEGGMSARYVPGYLIYAVAERQNALVLPDRLTAAASVVAAPFADGRITGDDRIPIVGNIATTQMFGLAQFVAASNGVFAWIAAPEPVPKRLVWLTLGGQETAVSLPRRPYREARLSPDGRTLAVTFSQGENGVWLADLNRGLVDRINAPIEHAASPVWSPDGRELAAWAESHDGAGLTGVVRIPVADPQNVRVLSAARGRALPTSWHRSGETLSLDVLTIRTRIDLGLLSVGSGGVQLLMATPAAERNGRFSPDGTWLAYETDGSVYVQAHPGGSRRTLLAPGALQPIWAPDGNTVFVKRGREILAVPFAAATGTPGAPRKLFEHAGQPQDISPDGTRLLLLVADEAADPAPLLVTVGWLEGVLTRGRQ